MEKGLEKGMGSIAAQLRALGADESLIEQALAAAKADAAAGK